MALPPFIDRISTTASIAVVPTTSTKPVNWNAASVFKQVSFSTDVIEQPDAGYIVLDHANIISRANQAPQKATNLLSSSAYKFVPVTARESFVDVPTDPVAPMIITDNPVIFVDTTPRVVFWS